LLPTRKTAAEEVEEEEGNDDKVDEDNDNDDKAALASVLAVWLLLEEIELLDTEDFGGKFGDVEEKVFVEAILGAVFEAGKILFVEETAAVVVVVVDDDDVMYG
jgi:hypothetical protein